MSKDKKHMDELEEFYRSTFDSSEMDIPSALTDSVINKLQGNNINKSGKRRLSDGIGATKLYRFLQVSLLFNLITVTTLGVYLLNNEQEVIIIKTPINELIIQEESEDGFDIKEEQNESVPSMIQSKQRKIHPPNIKQTNKVKKQPLAKEVLGQQKNDDAVFGEEIAVDSIKQEVFVLDKDSSEVKVDDLLEIDNNPVDLKELRNRYKDTVKGKPLFK